MANRGRAPAVELGADAAGGNTAVRGPDTDFAEAVFAARRSADLNGIGDMVMIVHLELVLLFLVPKEDGTISHCTLGAQPDLGDAVVTAAVGGAASAGAAFGASAML